MRTVKLSKTAKKQQQQKQPQKQIVGFDLGNNWVRTAYANAQTITKHNLLIQNTTVYLNKTATPACLTDSVSLLAKKWMDQSFQSVVKYYDYTFQKGINKNIILLSKNENIGHSYYIELALAFLIRGTFTKTVNLNYLLQSKKHIKLVCTIFEGKLNPYRIALSQCFKLSNIHDLFFTNTSICVATSYLKENRTAKDDTEVIGVVDFGAQGMTFSLHKLYYTDPGFVQTLFYEISNQGGLKLTRLLVDYVTRELIRQKGMDLNKSSFLMHKLKLLCDEAKHVLSINEKAFIRLDGLPDILVYGCQVSIKQFEKCIEKEIQKNVTIIQKGLKQTKGKVSNIVLTGGSCQIPLFRRKLKQMVGQIPVIEAASNWIKEGLLSVKTEQIHVTDICPFSLRMEGDQNLAMNLIQKGQLIPLRKRHLLKFPSGQLSLTIKFYQNNQLVATFVVPERPRQNTFSLFVEVDHNKMLNIYATTTQGLIKTHINLVEIPKQQYLKYGELLDSMNFLIDNE